MADIQKPAEVPQETPVAEPVVETTPAETTAVATTEAAAAPAVEATPASATDAVAATETAEAAAPVEEAKKEEEAKPVEEGQLEHKGQGANFPKNFLYTKQLFWFGTDPVDLKAISSFKADKVADVAHHVTAWAAETGKGFLFYSEKGDKAAPNGAIHLADASEPAVDGAQKFHFTAKGHKHTFKAANVAERDNWVAQVKAKIAEAKELAATVTETETYKKTLESLKPAPVKKEEKAPAAAEPAVAEPAAVTEEAPAATEAAAAEPAKDEAPKEEEKVEKEEPKRRSASRKRASIFGNFLGKKEEKKVVETTEVKPAEVEAAPVAEASAAAAAVETPVVEAAAEPVVAVPAVTEAATEAKPEEAAEEAKPEEEKKETAEARPTPAKRSSIFSLSFGKKKAAVPAEVSPTKEAPTTTEAVAENAPVIPAVETSEPLSTEVSSPATVPTETVEVTPATNGETKKEMKTEKRKSSLPFAFGKKKEGASSDEEAEKPKSPSAFSKLRATIKGKGKTEKTEKAEETPAVPALPVTETEATATEAAAEEAAKPAEVEATAAAPAVAEEETPAKPLEATPVVTATA
ncbi:Pleckstrin homology domain-containing protein [Chaetomidium leptoderma]|uniref:Pleckstrin homology domain-containing protein n=1 Tax=Chaetomidium leptoderma TaxID=669021 RepID=A0AAN6VPT1_9PEZI|nr:Pleckstrin homology domain-containing protein [Chaetomidium leptoderma]